MTRPVHTEFRDTDPSPTLPNYAGRILPPVELSPYEDSGELTPQAVELLTTGIDQALQQLQRSDYRDTIPASAVERAVIFNFKRRFESAEKSFNELVERRHGSDIYRRMMKFHQHHSPNAALTFFAEIRDLPSIDLAGIVVTDDSRNIVSEILSDSYTHYPSAIEVFDRIPEIEFLNEEVDGHFIFSVDKVLFEDQSSETVLPRRKTYVASREWVEQTVVTDPDAFMQMFVGTHRTPKDVYPVIESIYAHRRISLGAYTPPVVDSDVIIEP